MQAAVRRGDCACDDGSGGDGGGGNVPNETESSHANGLEIRVPEDGVSDREADARARGDGRL